MLQDLTDHKVPLDQWLEICCVVGQQRVLTILACTFQGETGEPGARGLRGSRGSPVGGLIPDL